MKYELKLTFEIQTHEDYEALRARFARIGIPLSAFQSWDNRKATDMTRARDWKRLSGYKPLGIKPFIRIETTPIPSRLELP